MSIPSYKPKCPNHGCPLAVQFPMPKKGSAPCEVSGQLFEYEVEIDEAKNVLSKDGTVSKQIGWKVTGED